MCVAAHSDPRIRYLISIGMIFLVLSLGVGALGHTFRGSLIPLDFVRGLFLGICLALEMRALWLVRRLRRVG
jgi:hypothetical protein